jgi:hypothetical protein
MASVDGTVVVTVQLDDDLRAELDAIKAMLDDARSPAHRKEHIEVVTRVAVLEERLDHMQERLSQKGARIRHLEALVAQLSALPGVQEAIEAASRQA